MTALAMNDARNARWRFNRCEFDGASLELCVDGLAVPLEPKPLQLLLYFLQHADEVVTKDELHASIWPGRILSESVLTKCVAKLRHAIQDGEQTTIATVHGYGYRFVAQLEREERAAVVGEGALTLETGYSPPLRPLWQLISNLGSGAEGEVWLGEHSKTRERRVFKFALDASGLIPLKREVVVYRLLRETYGERDDLVRLMDWNFDQPPFFIEAELVDGGSLPQWVERQGGFGAVAPATRVELVAQAADALAAAHAAGVLHQDLKPANLLVDTSGPSPRIKLSDLGCARVMDPDSLSRMAVTHTGILLDDVLDGSGGTPLYLAPERVVGGVPTVKSDIYALGVILYQFLVGDWRRSLAPGWELDVADEVLSEDIAAMAAGHATDRLGDASRVARDLRALEQRRLQRVQQKRAQEETELLRRALAHSRVRRQWSYVVMAVLAVGICATSVGFWRAYQEGQRAHAANLETRAAVEFFSEDVLAATDPFGGGRPRLSLHALLSEVAPKLSLQLADFPQARAQIGYAMGRAFEGLGDWVSAEQRLRAALLDAETVLGPDAELSLSIAERLGYVLMLQGVFVESEALFNRVYSSYKTRLGDIDARVLEIRDDLAWLEFERGDFEESARRYEAIIRDADPTNPDAVGQARWSLADCYLELNQLEGAEAQIRAAIQHSSAEHGDDHPTVLWQMTILGDVLMTQGRYDESALVFDRAYAGLAAQVGETHPYTLTALHYQGVLQLERGDPVAALPLLQRAYENRKRTHGEQHIWTRYSASRVGEALIQMGLSADALPILRRAYADAVTAQGVGHPNVLSIQRNLGDALSAQGEYAEAEQLLAAALAAGAQRLPVGNLRIAMLHESLGRLMLRQNRDSEAQVELAAAYEAWASGLGPSHPRALSVLSLRAQP